LVHYQRHKRRDYVNCMRMMYWSISRHACQHARLIESPNGAAAGSFPCTATWPGERVGFGCSFLDFTSALNRSRPSCLRSRERGFLVGRPRTCASVLLSVVSGALVVVVVGGEVEKRHCHTGEAVILCRHILGRHDSFEPTAANPPSRNFHPGHVDMRPRRAQSATEARWSYC